MMGEGRRQPPWCVLLTEKSEAFQDESEAEIDGKCRPHNVTVKYSAIAEKT